MAWQPTTPRKVVLLLVDAALLLLALYVAGLVRFGEALPVAAIYRTATPIFVGSFLVCFYLLELYNLALLPAGVRSLVRLLAASILGLLVSSTLFYFLFLVRPEYRYGRGILVLASLIAAALIHVWRRLASRMWLYATQAVPTLVVGTRVTAETVRQLLDRQNSRYRIIGFLTTAREPAQPLVSPDRILGDLAGVRRLVEQHRIGCVVMASDAQGLSEAQAEELTRLKFSGVSVIEAAQFYMRVAEALPLEFLNESWLLFAEGFELMQAKMARRVKRISDVVLASLGLLLALPVLLPAALLLKLTSRGPVLAGEEYVGWLERPFRRHRFRIEEGRVAHLLRALRLDGIPQLLNVLQGEMSIVGPCPERPDVVAQTKAVLPFYHLRHYVPPGLTGWAQLKYPQGVFGAPSLQDAKQRLELDLYYIMNASIWLDYRILLEWAGRLFARGESRQQAPARSS